MNRSKALVLLNRYIEKNHKTYAAFAREAGVTSSYLCQQLRGDEPLSKTILEPIGLERVTTDNYYRIGDV